MDRKLTAEVVEIFDNKDPLDIAKSDEDIAKVVEYQRQVREHVQSLERKGKRVTSKYSKDEPKEAPEGETPESALDVLTGSTQSGIGRRLFKPSGHDEAETNHRKWYDSLLPSG